MANASSPCDVALQSLNAAQKRAVCSSASTVAILAGPGSGKTHTLTSRVVWLLEAAGYEPQDVIVATFTVKAAREMKERIGKALSDGRQGRLILGTFHSIARRYLAAYGSKIGLNQKFGIADDSDSRAIISRICKRLQLSVEPQVARAWISKQKAKGTESDILPKRRQPPGKVPETSKALETCFEEYQSHLKLSNLLDYDDLLVCCVNLLRQYPSCVSNVQAVLIDEYQDTNGVQYELTTLFAQKNRRITIVGDPDQSIYGWRSAEIRNLHRLLQEYPGTDQVALEENYRSSQHILDASLRVIQQDEKRYQKALKATHSPGSRPVLRRLRTPAKEAEWIVSEIKRAVMMSGNMINRDDIAILLRSASLSRHIETAMGKAGIAYRMVGGFKFYERTEIKILLDYLRIIHQPDNNDALARIINVPRRGIGDTTVKSLIEEAERSSMSLWALLVKHCRGDRLAKTNIKKQVEQRISGELIRFLNGIRKRIEEATPETPFTIVDMVERLLSQLKFQAYLEENFEQDHEQRWANVQEFLGLAGDFMKEVYQVGDEALPDIDGVDQTKEVEVLTRFLANISLASDVQTNDEQDNVPLVTISTIHAAKGLEWPIVFVPAAYNGSIPHMRSEDNNEERRLLYVAMTRAKALLYLSCPMYGSQGSGEKVELSPFLTPTAAHFAKIGPDLERHRLTEIASILRREVPSDEFIFKSMPLLASVRDDLFPEDPEAQFKSDTTSTDNLASDRPRLKRPRLYGPTGTGAAGDEDGGAWRKDYSITMEQSSGFTVSSLPGFTTAGAHQTALAATVVAETGKQAPKGSDQTKSKRPADQSSLLGFVRTPSNAASRPAVVGAAPSLSASRPASLAVNKLGRNSLAQRTASRPPAIDPTLASHRLRTGKPMPRPAQPNRDNEAAANQYAQFSSSPPRLAPPLEPEPDTDSQQSVNHKNPESRPASCFHTTTVAMPNGMGGFRRPAGLTREGIAPMDKLRKPFKPLTISRPK